MNGWGKQEIVKLLPKFVKIRYAGGGIVQYHA